MLTSLQWIMQHTNNKTTPSRAKIITNQLIRMSSMPQIMSNEMKCKFTCCQIGYMFNWALHYSFTNCKYPSSGRRFIVLRALLSQPCGPLSAIFIVLKFSKELAFTRWRHALHARIRWALAGLALEFCRLLRASVRSFISIRQVAPHDLDLDLP